MCLGHQVLCSRLGIDLGYKDIVFQGTQSRVSLAGREENVGFYNTFVGRVDGTGLPEGVEVAADPESGDIHLVSGPHFRGCSSTPSRSSPSTATSLIHDLVLELLT